MDKAPEPPILCKICLVDYAHKGTYNQQQCHCIFCIECLQQYLSFEIMTGNIKQCPLCHVPIERDAGCAQMKCKRCKHIFCWFCLKYLGDDILLQHYSSGKCKGKLGHTRA